MSPSIDDISTSSSCIVLIAEIVRSVLEVEMVDTFLRSESNVSFADFNMPRVSIDDA